MIHKLQKVKLTFVLVLVVFVPFFSNIILNTEAYNEYTHHTIISYAIINIKNDVSNPSLPQSWRNILQELARELSSNVEGKIKAGSDYEDSSSLLQRNHDRTPS